MIIIFSSNILSSRAGNSWNLISWLRAPGSWPPDDGRIWSDRNSTVTVSKNLSTVQTCQMKILLDKMYSYQHLKIFGDMKNSFVDWDQRERSCKVSGYLSDVTEKRVCYWMWLLVVAHVLPDVSKNCYTIFLQDEESQYSEEKKSPTLLSNTANYISTYTDVTFHNKIIFSYITTTHDV
jgi:hypothetical protein